MLDAFALIFAQEFLYLRFIVRRFVDRNSDFAAGAGHGLAHEAGKLAFDIEIADLAEIEYTLIIPGPFFHIAAIHVVGQVIDCGKTGTLRMSFHSRQITEVDIVNRLFAITIYEVNKASADAFDRRDGKIPSACARRMARAASFTRNAIAFAEGPC